MRADFTVGRFAASDRPFETALTPGFEKDNGHGVGEIEAAAIRKHGDPKHVRHGFVGHQLVGESDALLPEEKRVALAVVDVGVAGRSVTRERVDTIRLVCQVAVEILMLDDSGEFPVVGSGPTQLRFIYGEPKRVNEVNLQGGFAS